MEVEIYWGVEPPQPKIVLAYLWFASSTD